jgi:hypothetical protein
VAAPDGLLQAATRPGDAGEPTFTYGLLYAAQTHGGANADANLATAAALVTASARDWPIKGARS